jgi:hypothetical protein
MDADAGLAGRGKTAAFVGAEPSFSFFFSKVFGTTRGGEMIVATPPGGLLRESDLG